MKWIGSILWIVLFMAVGCNDYYDGEKRYVIEGILLDGTEIIENEQVILFSKRIYAYKVSEEEEEKYSQPASELPYGEKASVLSTVMSDSNGNFKIGFPGGDNWVFYIKVRDKFYGYVSYRNMPNYYYNFRELSINEEE